MKHENCCNYQKEVRKCYNMECEGCFSFEPIIMNKELNDNWSDNPW